jgi:hypothetical protein
MKNLLVDGRVGYAQLISTRRAALLTQEISGFVRDDASSRRRVVVAEARAV